jgi:hypothetical protein
MFQSHDKKTSKYFCFPPEFYGYAADFLVEGNAEFDNTILGFTSNKRYNMDIDIFKKLLLDITIYLNGCLHFSQAFVVNPGIVLKSVKHQLGDEFDEIPCIIICDSCPGFAFHPKREDIGNVIRQCLNYESNRRHGSTVDEKLPNQNPIW